MSVYNYDAKDCTVIVDGVHITGLGEDMISFEKDEAFFETTVGAQGDVVRNVKNDPLGTATVYVQATSPQKKFLMGLAKAKKPFPLWCINKALGERVGGSQASLETFPEIARGAEAEDMEFVFKVFDFVCEGI